MSWDGATGLRGDNAIYYCDKIKADFAESTDSYEFVTSSGMTGLKKCSYIVVVAPTKGAPGFKLTHADWTSF